MKNPILTEQSRHLTDMIREQTETVLGYETRIPQIELDILLENVRKLYEALKELEKRNAAAESGAALMPQEETPLNKPQEPIDIKISMDTAVDNQPAREETPPMAHVQTDELLIVVDVPVESPKAQITAEEVIPQATLSTEKAKGATKSATLFDEDVHTVADRFTSAPSVNDRIVSTRNEHSISAKLSSNPIADLKKAIGINEKFALVNELFEGDINAYNDAIEVLNSASDEHQALSYMNSTLVPKYGWDTADESYQKLRSLVERRY